MNSLLELQNIYWREPWFILLALQPFLIFAFKQLVKSNQQNLFTEKKLQPWVILSKSTIKTQIFSKNMLYIIAWLLLALALAGPRIPLQQSSQKELIGANIMFVVDISPSMQATDVLPNRLQRSKIELYEFLEQAQQHRIGITVFSARPHLYVPLTSDYNVLKTYLKSLDKLSLPTLGSDPISAIELAAKTLSQDKGKAAIVLMTDGDFDQTQNKTALNILKKNNIPLYILGMATVEGEAIPLNDGTWLKHENQAVISRMDESQLQNLASQYNGKYSHVYDDNTDWNTLYQQGVAQHKNTLNVDSKQQTQWQQLFPYFLFPALVLFFVALSRQRLFAMPMQIFAIAMTLSLSSLGNKNAVAFEMFSTNEQIAYQAYKNKQYTKAEDLYKILKGYSSHLGQGSSLYKKGHYQEAIQQFTFAVINSKTDPQRASALYNLANSYFRSGKFSSAITTYRDVLRYQADHAASKYNLNISQVLQKDIEKRIKENAWVTNIRQGRGPRSGAVAENTQLNDNTRVSLGEGDNKNSKEKHIPLPDLPGISSDALIKLLSAGLNDVKLAENNRQKNLSYINSNEYSGNIDGELIRVQQNSNAITDSQHQLWKRVFEIEEGFPAPVETPHTLPEVNPW